MDESFSLGAMLAHAVVQYSEKAPTVFFVQLLFARWCEITDLDLFCS